MRIALKVDVSTIQGAQQGVPALLRLFDEHQVRASFLLCLGPDCSGHGLAGILPQWLCGRRAAPAIWRRTRDVLQAVAEAGHEVGISAYSPTRWRADVAFRERHWTRREVLAAVEKFQLIFGRPPRLHGALDWQINAHLLRLQQELGFSYACDVRGKSVFLPVMENARFACPQIPTTLPTLDELMNVHGVAAERVHEYMFAECQRLLPQGEVYSLSAEREGLDLLPVLRRLLVMWQGSQRKLQALDDLFNSLGDTQLAHHRIGWGQVAGRSGHLAMQSVRLAN